MKRFFSLILILALFSCSKDQNISPSGEDVVPFSISVTMPEFENDDATKASISYITRLTWTKDTDKISVINVTRNKILGGELTAASTGTTTTFSGNLSGTVADGDKLLFIYPSQGNASEEDFSGVTLDFSSQEGTSSSKVFIAVYAVGTASSTSGTMSVKTAQTQFSFLASYHYLALTNLPSSSLIEEIRFKGIPTKMRVEWDSANNSIATTPILEYTEKTNADGTVEKHQTEYITLKSTNNVTSASGSKAAYLTTPYVAANNGFDRTVTVFFDGGQQSYSATLSNSEYKLAYNTRRIVSTFKLDEVTTRTLSFSADMPQLSGTNAPSRAWTEGDEVTVVNLTKNKILWPNIVAQSSGSTTVLEGDFDLSDSSIDSGDQLLLVYPGLELDGSKTFSEYPLEFDFSTQSGTLDAVPYVMTATVSVGSSSSAVEFAYQTAVSKLAVSGVYDAFSAASGKESTPGKNTGTGASNEGYGVQFGSWGESTGSDVTVNQVNVTAETAIPSKLTISYNSTSGYASSFATATSITLNGEQTLTQSNPDLNVYLACPGVANASTSYSISADVYSATLDDPCKTSSVAISPQKSTYKEYSLEVSSGGGSGGVVDDGSDYTVTIAGETFTRTDNKWGSATLTENTTINDSSLENMVIFLSDGVTLTLGSSAKLSNTLIVAKDGDASVNLGGASIESSSATVGLKNVSISGTANLDGSIDQFLVDGCDVAVSEDNSSLLSASSSSAIGALAVASTCIHSNSSAQSQFSILDASSTIDEVRLSDNMLLNITSESGSGLVNAANASNVTIERNHLHNSSLDTDVVFFKAGSAVSSLTCTSNSVYSDSRSGSFIPCKGSSSYVCESDPLTGLDVAAGEYTYSDMILAATSDFDSEGYSSTIEKTVWTKSGTTFSLPHCPGDITIDYIVLPEVAVTLSGSWGSKTATGSYRNATKSYTLNLPDYVASGDVLTSTTMSGTWTLKWADEFTGTDWDRNVWTRCPKQSAAWTLGQDVDDESLVEVSNGSLILHAKNTGDTSKGVNGYTVGGIWGLGLKSFGMGMDGGTGRIDICATMTDATGYWPAIWMMPQQTDFSWPQWGEIDIMEHLNSETIYYATLHTWADGSKKGSGSDAYVDTSYGSTAQFTNRTSKHVFTVIVSSSQIQLLLDGKATFTQNKSSITSATDIATLMNYWPFASTEYYMIMDSQVGGGWCGAPSGTYSNVNMTIDYVRYMVKQ